MSGFGFSGGLPRCFAYWQEFQKCYAKSDKPSECTPQSNDYTECLHHPREIARAAAIQAELNRKIEKAVKEHQKASESKADSVSIGVGLIKREGSEESSSK
ncbi:hypothetical protein D9611_010472 [Ephemerocybe angulata]|uniref:NADH dehydrogenase [ubiquinone] iron-sulfur protein 5 n=1 Tax=Ephemerocybe angulata TaxID=980116 RepID=A0A8H5BVL2_9AGAR|nr:hypothetical protein D9611_010472 [Tulosesus angulatus]